MDGILIVNKPKGITSHDVVSIVRKAYQTKKVGHVGTLDPIAEGVLVILINKATKLANFLEPDDKTYECTVRIGLSTDSFDITGNTIEEVNDFNLNNDKIDNALKFFLNETIQFPPIYSAIKYAGKKLYQYAREGKNIELKPRSIKIYSINRISDIFKIDDNMYFKFITKVSKGTYIRSIVNDLGKKLNIPCCMSDLKRVQSGQFSLKDSFNIDDIKEGKSHLVKMTDSIKFKKINIHDDQELLYKVKNGMKLSTKLFQEQMDRFAIINNDDIIAIYEFNKDVYPCYKAVRVWLD